MSAQTVDHYPISLHFHGRQQPAHPPLAHPHLLGRPSLRHLSVSDAFQPIQPVAFLLAHRDTFHPSSLAAVKRTVLLCPIRNFSHCRDKNRDFMLSFSRLMIHWLLALSHRFAGGL